jgi:hypothetical protein
MICGRKQSYRDIWRITRMQLAALTIGDEIYDYTQNSDKGTSREEDTLDT